MNLYRTLCATALTLLTSAAVCLAQEETTVGVPTPEESRRAAVGMLFTMLGGLTLVVLLLRWVGRKQPPPPRTPDDSLFDRAVEYFDKQGK